MWCIPPKENAEFVANMEDVLEIYTLPYDEKRPVVCIDESSKQLIGEIRTPIPIEPGNPEKYDSEYVRNGVCNMFMSFEPLSGIRHVKVTDHRTSIDWALYIKEIVDVQYSQADKIVIVQDNLNTHTPASLYKAFNPKEARRIINKLEFHYTPKHGSWLDMAEIELSVLSRQLPKRIPTKEELVAKVAAWEKKRNNKVVKVNWQFTTADARIKLRKLYPVFDD
jgi:hypothetical protein